MLGASVWLVSDVACKQSIQQVRESREALHVGRCVEERRGGSGGAAVHGGGTCLGELWIAHGGERARVSCKRTCNSFSAGNNLLEAGRGVIARKGVRFLRFYSGGNRLHSLSVT